MLLAGLFAGTNASPVSWAKLVVAREYAASAVVPALPLARPDGLVPSWAALGLIVPAALAFAAAASPLSWRPPPRRSPPR